MFRYHKVKTYMTIGRLGEKNAAVLFFLLTAFNFFGQFNNFRVVSTLHIIPGKQLQNQKGDDH
jgi:hypothetical protein